ncbi:uncharacterized protein LOC9657646 [Selaginella moellendorffii]|uniref:uncharacterized protein LOC9657646 n=1 Tax=Selaginella moellendorffii TaxID=88036 RepID=UPI000D1C906A|nr:uncharacterized protein LOC9657646 [Selaginella moellendorffii]|eukprot:XP_024541793.1 uncharacterized protein LOC9657646 [Selaginella moellendorffii]
MTSFVTFILVAVISSVCNAQDLSFTATTPGLTKGKPNTFIGTTGDEIASSLLASKTPAMLWGSVPASAITNVCQKISQTGRQEYTAKIDGDWGGSEDLKLKVTSTLVFSHADDWKDGRNRWLQIHPGHSSCSQTTMAARVLLFAQVTLEEVAVACT